jgi:hypothetical protein
LAELEFDPGTTLVWMTPPTLRHHAVLSRRRTWSRFSGLRHPFSPSGEKETGGRAGQLEPILMRNPTPWLLTHLTHH